MTRTEILRSIAWFPKFQMGKKKVKNKMYLVIMWGEISMTEK